MWIPSLFVSSHKYFKFSIFFYISIHPIPYMFVTKKGGSKKPAELTRSPTDPGSHTLSIHLRSTDTSPFLTWTIFLPSLTDLLAIWRLTNPATHHPTQHTQLWSYITHRCLWGKNTQTSFMDCIHSPRAQALPSNTISYKNRRRWLSLQFFLSLSLPILLQQWARPHIRRSGNSQSWPRLPATELLTLLTLTTFSAILLPKTKTSLLPITPPPLSLSLSLAQSSLPLQKQTSDLFFQFSVGFLQKLLPIFQRRSILPASSSALSPS